MKIFCIIVVLLAFVTLTSPFAMGQSPAGPTEDELLDFDNVDKGGTAAPPPEVAQPPSQAAPAVQGAAPAPPSQAVAPAPAPQAAPPPEANAPATPPPAAPAPAKKEAQQAPPAPADNNPPPPDMNGAPPPAAPVVQGAPPPAAPPAAAVPPANSGVSNEDASALEGPPPSTSPNITPEPKPPGLPADNGNPPPPEVPPPPEIVNEGAAPAPAPAPEEMPAPTDEAPPATVPAPETEPPPAQTVEAPPPASEAPGEISDSDRRNEARFARIYQKYNQQEIGDEKWTQIAGDKSSENYSIQGGDNLWDISSKFFGNGFYWPKVWQLNDQITNPHYVMVGKNLQFQPGSTTAAPSLAVQENTEEKQNTDLDVNVTDTNKSDANVELSFEDMPEPAPEIDEIPTEQEPEGNTIIIPPPKKHRPVLAKIPSSFPDWRDHTGIYDTNGFSMEVFKPIESHRIGSPIIAMVTEDPWDPSGKIVEMEGGSTTSSIFQYVIIKMTDKVSKGDVVTVYSDNGKVTSPLDRETIGSEIETRALVTIQDPVEGVEDAYRGFITYADLPVRMGDLVKKGNLIKRADFDSQGTPSKVSARIVNGEMGERTVFGLHAIVFLDRGSADGLQVGSLLPVLANEKLRNAKTIIGFDPRPIGMLKVVTLENRVATAIIVNERDAIFPGDETAIPANNELHPEDSVLTAPPPPGGAAAGPVEAQESQTRIGVSADDSRALEGEGGSPDDKNAPPPPAPAAPDDNGAPPPPP